MAPRRVGSGLFGRAAKTATRTALIAGVATAVSSKVAKRQTGGDGAHAAPLSSEAMDQRRQLAELHSNGVLTDEEFTSQKTRTLG